MTQKTTSVVEPQPEIDHLIRELRQHWGLTQEEYAANRRVAFPTVNRWKQLGEVLSPLAMEEIEGLLKVFSRPSVTWHELGYGSLSNYFPQKEYRR